MKIIAPVLAALLGLVAAAPACADDLPKDVVVRRGAASVDLSLIDAHLSRVPKDKRAGFMNDPERIELLLQNMLVTLQLADEAEREGLADDPVIANELRLARAELLAKKHLAQYMGKLQMPDFEQLARERYLTSPDLYNTAETRDLRHLIVMHRNHGVDGARERAEQLLAEFRKQGGDFDAFVREHSEESTAKTDGGLLEGVGKGDVDGGFYQAAFGLKRAGELSEPTMSRYGYHLIELVKTHPARRKEFDEVKAEIVAELKREFVARSRAEYLDNVKAAAPLEANPDLVVSLRSRYLSDGAGTTAMKTADAIQAAAQATAESEAGAAPADQAAGD